MSTGDGNMFFIFIFSFKKRRRLDYDVKRAMSVSRSKES